MAVSGNQQFSITYLARLDIENKREGLSEPSGLALSACGDALWVISDDTRRIFQINLDGEIKPDDTIKINDKGLEGITLDPAGKHLLAVVEDGNAFIKAELGTQTIVQRQRLNAMRGFGSIEPYFSTGSTNNGLEGIAWNSSSETVFALKEGQPGLLIEVSPDLQSILNHRVLGAEQGFLDRELAPEAIDFSGLCHDRQRDCLWIISDKARRLFLYDWQDDRVIQSCRLAYGDDGDYREINKAEGIAVNPEANRLFIVSDKEARLYIFDLRS